MDSLDDGNANVDRGGGSKAWRPTACPLTGSSCVLGDPLLLAHRQVGMNEGLPRANSA